MKDCFTGWRSIIHSLGEQQSRIAAAKNPHRSGKESASQRQRIRIAAAKNPHSSGKESA